MARLPHPLRSSMLPRLALLALFSSSTAHAAAAAEPAPSPEPTCEPERRVLVVDGAAHTPCASLFGTAEDRALYRQWRESYLDVIDTDGPALDIVHGVSALHPPALTQPAGLSLRELRRARVQETCASETSASETDADDADEPTAEGETETETAETEEWMAVFDLDESLAAYCPSSTVFLRVDDALGSAGRVLWMSERGVLALLDDRLIWLPADDTPAPQFRMTWRSGFLVTSTSSGGGVSSGSKATGSKATGSKASAARKARARKRSARKKR